MDMKAENLDFTLINTSQLPITVSPRKQILWVPRLKTSQAMARHVYSIVTLAAIAIGAIAAPDSML